MLIFSGTSNRPLAEKIAEELGVDFGELEINTFPDNENRVMVLNKVLDEDVVLVQSTGISPNLYYMELFLILDGLKRSGAKSITLVMPYMGYQRQDHIFRSGEAVSLEVIVKIIEELGVDKTISFDLHSIKISEIFKKEIKELSALSLFAEKIKEMDLNDFTLVSPDMGGIRRIKILSELLNNAPYISIEKDRDLESGEIELSKINGKVTKIAIMVDDVISSGGTITKGAKFLLESGAEEVYAMAVHGIFAEEGHHNLENSDIKKVIVTDSIEIPEDRKFSKLEIISISKIISQELRK